MRTCTCASRVRVRLRLTRAPAFHSCVLLLPSAVIASEEVDPSARLLPPIWVEVHPTFPTLKNSIPCVLAAAHMVSLTGVISLP